MTMPRTVLSLAAALLPMASALAQTSNTLLIVADDVGVDAIASYGLGANPPPTPNIDALAASGVRFTNAQSCPVCSPTRASLLTGRHPFRTGIGKALDTNQGGLLPGETLLPEILSPAGVATALFGKWHLGDENGACTPTMDGFGQFKGTTAGLVPSYYNWPKAICPTTTPTPVYATTDVVTEALAFVSTTPGPWFLEVAFHAGHAPYHTPPAGLHTQNLAGLNPAVTPIPFFKAMVEAMDFEIGRLLAGIPAATLANTNVVFLGDNGTSATVVEAPFTAPHAKGTIYQGGVRVPLIVAGPAVVGGPRVEPSLVHAVDLFATLAAMQGVDAHAAVPPGVVLDSVSLSPLLQAAGQPAVREFAYSEFFTGTEAMSVDGDAEVIRSAQYSLLRFRQAGAETEEMYDLAADPWQATDLLLQPLSAGVEAAYRDLWRALAQLRGYAWTQPYGAGCGGAGVTPLLRAITEPVIGTTFTMRVTGLNPTVIATIGAIGFSDDQWLGTPLPLDLTAIGMTGCSVLVSPDITRFLVTGPQAAPWSEALPNDPTLVGFGFFTQAFLLAPNANPTGALATRALEVMVGSI